jgi:sporulation protein YlmC with PRC-barrel domain
MRLSDLRNKPIRTLDGKRLGRVHEVHCEGGRVIALTAGPGSLVERLTAKNNGRRIPWGVVKRVEPTEIIVGPNPPQRRPTGSKPRATVRKPAESTRNRRTSHS